VGSLLGVVLIVIGARFVFSYAEGSALALVENRSNKQ
jgi:hypothetical protein